MPVTFPAHQAVVLPIKLRWPDRTDATAMCVGAAAPDLWYPVAGIGDSAHSLVGVLVGVVPLTMGICWVLRRRSALGVFANLPDAGPFRVHSYRVISSRRPAVTLTIVGALIGALSHVLLDAFTHSDRWGSELLGLDDVLFTVPIRGEMSGARVLQYIGHGLGSLIAIGLFLYIGRSRRLEEWYGAAAVAAARRFTLSGAERLRFWLVLAGVALLVSAALSATGGSPAFSAVDGLVAGALAAGAFVTGAAPVADAAPRRVDRPTGARADPGP